MKTSELILALQDALKAFGDMEVYVAYEGTGFHIERGNVYSSRMWDTEVYRRLVIDAEGNRAGTDRVALP